MIRKLQGLLGEWGATFYYDGEKKSWKVLMPSGARTEEFPAPTFDQSVTEAINFLENNDSIMASTKLIKSKSIE